MIKMHAVKFSLIFTIVGLLVSSYATAETATALPMLELDQSKANKKYLSVSGSEIVESVLEFIGQLDTRNFAMHKSKLLQKINVDKIVLYRLSDRDNRILDADDYRFIEHLLLSKLSEIYRIIECIECNNRRVTVHLDKIIQQSIIATSEQANNIVTNLGADGILFWGINLDKEDDSIYFRLVDAAGKIVFTHEQLLNELQEHRIVKKNWWSITLSVPRVIFDTQIENSSGASTSEEETNLPFVGIKRQWDFPEKKVSMYIGGDMLLITPPFCDAVTCSPVHKDPGSSTLSGINVYRLMIGVRNYQGPIHSYIAAGALSLDIIGLTSDIGTYTEIGMAYQFAASGWSVNMNYISFSQPIDLTYEDQSVYSKVTIGNASQYGLGVEYRW